jgi:hypothetical protein
LEVLQEIFAHVPCSSDGKTEASRTFAALARTCTAFHEPAMDLLWADMCNYGILPLLGCVTRLHPMIYGHDGKVGEDA